MPEICFHHISLTCQDPIAVERFYTKYFGFKRVRVVPLGDRQIELFQATEDRPVPPPERDGYPWPSVRNISFEVDDIDAALKAMASGGMRPSPHGRRGDRSPHLESRTVRLFVVTTSSPMLHA